MLFGILIFFLSTWSNRYYFHAARAFWLRRLLLLLLLLLMYLAYCWFIWYCCHYLDVLNGDFVSFWMSFDVITFYFVHQPKRKIKINIEKGVHKYCRLNRSQKQQQQQIHTKNTTHTRVHLFRRTRLSFLFKINVSLELLNWLVGNTFFSHNFFLSLNAINILYASGSGLG